MLDKEDFSRATASLFWIPLLTSLLWLQMSWGMVRLGGEEKKQIREMTQWQCKGRFSDLGSQGYPKSLELEEMGSGRGKWWECKMMAYLFVVCRVCLEHQVEVERRLVHPLYVGTCWISNIFLCRKDLYFGRKIHTHLGQYLHVKKVKATVWLNECYQVEE